MGTAPLHLGWCSTATTAPPTICPSTRRQIIMAAHRLVRLAPLIGDDWWRGTAPVPRICPNPVLYWCHKNHNHHHHSLLITSSLSPHLKFEKIIKNEISLKLKLGPVLINYQGIVESLYNHCSDHCHPLIIHIKLYPSTNANKTSNAQLQSNFVYKIF